MNPRNSLAFKLTLAFLFVGLVGAALMAFFFWQGTQRRFDQFIFDRDRSSTVGILAEYYQAHGGWQGVELGSQDFPPPPDRNWSKAPDIAAAIIVFDAQNRVVLTQGDIGAITRAMKSEMARAVPIEVNGAIVGKVVFAPHSRRPLPESPENRFRTDISRAIGYSALGAMAVALLLGIFLASTLTRPIRELTAATRSLARGDMDQKVEVQTKDEIGQLAESFNQMSADLARASRLRRKMTADIAHELRTPLSLILGYTESVSDGKLPATQETMDIMHDEAKRLSRLVDDLRVLSLADAGELSLDCYPTDPRSLLEQTLRKRSPEAQQRELNIQIESEPDLPLVNVDPDRLVQVLDNLVSNALRHTAAGGQVTLSAAVQDDQQSVVLQVSDTGDGIAVDDLPFVFDRFYRADQSRQRQGAESGLGLAIAKSIVESHGGSISVSSTVGRGATFTITLPVAAAA